MSRVPGAQRFPLTAVPFLPLPPPAKAALSVGSAAQREPACGLRSASSSCPSPDPALTYVVCSDSGPGGGQLFVVI